MHILSFLHTYNMSSTDLTVEPEIYSPSINEAGEYIDSFVSTSAMQHGIRCPCGSRKDKVYDTPASFHAHRKTKSHQEWLIGLNRNKMNYFQENEENKETIRTQRLIIAKLEKDLSCKLVTIDILTQQLSMMREIEKANGITKTHFD